MRIFATLLTTSGFLLGACNNSAPEKEIAEKEITERKKEVVSDDPIAPVSEKAQTVIDEKPTVAYVVKKYSALSKSFNLEVRLKQVSHAGFPSEYIEWTEVRVLNKKDSLLQQIRNLPTWDFYDDLEDVRSFETNFKENKRVVDGFMGKIVVDDFNIDSLSDFALIENVPMSGTPSYYFYLQQKDGTFLRSKYLTEKVHFIPEKIDREKRMVVTHGYTGCCAHTWDFFSVDSLGNFRKIKTVEKVSSISD